MAETAKQYVDRIFGYLGERKPLEVMAETPSKLAELVVGVDETRLSRRPAADKWSIRETLAHMADAEMVMGYRMRMILENNGTAIQGFNQDTWAGIAHYDRIPPFQSLERLRAQRHANIDLLRSLKPEQLEQYGVHSERGKETVAHIARMWAGHDLNHILQIQKMLG